jgi:hypothetical protein
VINLQAREQAVSWRSHSRSHKFDVVSSGYTQRKRIHDGMLILGPYLRRQTFRSTLLHMMANRGNEMKRKSTEDGGVSPPPLRRKVQSMTTRKCLLCCPPVQDATSRVPQLCMDKLTLRQKLLWLRFSHHSPRNHRKRLFGKSAL